MVPDSLSNVNVFKFGGASVKDAAGIRNLADIVRTYGDNNVVVVVSAMGKTTNALEEVVQAYADGHLAEALHRWEAIKAQHLAVERELTGTETAAQTTYEQLEAFLKTPYNGSFDERYDQIVSAGELMATQLVAAYLEQTGLPVRWADARRLVRTDATHREGHVDWTVTERQIRAFVGETAGVTITQGFLGQTPAGQTTTLGRDGSDYTAAIVAFCLDARSVTIWKDVPGVLNADPKYFDDTVLLEKLTYQDAIELAYYGATVIHPKTIKPLQNKRIPLFVRSFVEPEKPGTMVGAEEQHLPTASFIFKMNQTLISLHPLDFSFIAEDNLSRIFSRFAEAGVKINLMQNTAISFSVSVDTNPARLPRLLNWLKEDFRVLYNEGLELITIRYYDQQTIDRVLVNKTLLLEQKSRYTVQLVVRDRGE